MRGGVLKFRRWIGLGLLLSAALAQQLAGRNDAWPRWSAHGYFAGGSSVSENNAGFKGGGGGVEAFVWKRATVGADISILRDSYYTAVGTFGHAGAQAGYHFAGRERSRGADPFVLFGVGAYFPDESKPALHGGAGFTYWFKPRIGARFEFRVGARPYGDNVDGVARIGVAFR
jgi:hypothetical protein